MFAVTPAPILPATSLVPVAILSARESLVFALELPARVFLIAPALPLNAPTTAFPGTATDDNAASPALEKLPTSPFNN